MKKQLCDLHDRAMRGASCTCVNITCPRCRHRHPASLSCEEAKRLADEARAAREAVPEALIPSMRLRWRKVYRVEDDQIAVLVPGWTERGLYYVLEQAFRRPGSDEDIWVEVEQQA